MLAYLNAIATVLAMLTFFGIIWWAFSKGRKKANDESANLPFVVPDEVSEQKDKESRP
ncbi:CcoQ/FixQ family Cbb3-type cytochrome c oxidase assembly chaperone [Zwartia sp.]|uniref:cbb3-type cytochrome oxidase subunit 3 n=1 Tax=Zwartia sp. TaxID=2978004 RepID=UPI002724C84C|nr:CcoQ/FixQ family Cbb3-type cytochrome c oxidase assembly chaperone [Zwartia sp.]MDO9024874.1 CcoQ/FixQ family Cbb3-type cytochrome c oxidase assembly chaperone [Zwartia sp.]